MIKGIFLGICISIFVVSLIVLSFGITGELGPNIITGSVIGESQWITYSAITLILSFIIGMLIILKLRINRR